MPYLVHASGLTETDEEKDGLPVALTVRVRDDQNDSAAEATREAVLSTADHATKQPDEARPLHCVPNMRSSR